MKRTLLSLLCMVALLVSCQGSMEERAERDAREATEKRCPVRLAEDVIMERITFDKATLTWCQDYLFDVQEGIVIDETPVKEALVAELRNTPSYKPYMEHGFLFRYVYCRMSNPQDTVIDIVLTPKDYGKR